MCHVLDHVPCIGPCNGHMQRIWDCSSENVCNLRMVAFDAWLMQLLSSVNSCLPSLVFHDRNLCQAQSKVWSRGTRSIGKTSESANIPITFHIFMYARQTYTSLEYCQMCRFCVPRSIYNGSFHCYRYDMIYTHVTPYASSGTSIMIRIAIGREGRLLLCKWYS